MNTLRPPALAERLLAWALGPGDEPRAILGDLNEDFVGETVRRGRSGARIWYWREAGSLAVSAVVGRALGRPLVRHDDDGERTMSGIAEHGMTQDARYALRSVRRDPGFFVFATLIVGLGIGACSAVFSVMSPLLIQPLPFDDPGRLVLVENDDPDGGLSGITSRTSNLRDFREQARSFVGLAGYNAFFGQGSYNLVGGGAPERLVGVDVTDDFLDVLGVELATGRDFSPEEGLWDGPDAVVLTHGFWVRRFGADPEVVGTSISLNDNPHQVVGVLPASFDFSSVFTPTLQVDVLVPWPVADETDNWGNTTLMVGRLAPGATPEVAQAELESIVAGLEEADPERWGLGATTSRLQERIARPFRTGMLLLAAAAGLVMLIVCVNLSNMLLARSPRRKREMAVRRTMGATRGRLVRQLLLESVIVSLSGAAVGIGVAVAATRFVSDTQGLEIPLLSSVQVDGWALAFTVAVALVAGLGIGIVPALQVAEGGEAEALSGSSRGSSAGRRSRLLRELLVVSEVAIACVLLVFGGLVLRSFQQVMDVELGFEPTDAVAWELRSSRDFDDLPELTAFYDEIMANVEAVPGVQSAGLVDALPLGRNRTWGGRVVGKEYEDGEGESYFPHLIDHRYLDAMRIPVLEGRGFAATDDRSSALVAVVNETARVEMFPNGRAIGAFISMGWYGDVEIVGVVADVKHRGPELGGDHEVYLPMAQMWDFNTLDLVVRSELPPESLVAPIASAIRSVDPQMPTEDYRTLESVVDRAVSPRRFTLHLLIAFGGAALLIAGLGIYGVLSYSVTERTPEIGIRMALGESAAGVRRTVVGRTLFLAAAGVAVGTVIALFGTRLIASLLYGVEPTDPITFGVMIVVLLLVSLVSGLIPAIRASRTDSARALRSAA